jgi:phage tail-like protein
MKRSGFAVFAFSAFLFAAFLFAGMIGVSVGWAQRPSPPSSSQRAQTAPKPAADRFQRFRYRMAYSGQGAYLGGFSDVVVKGESSGASGQSPRRVQPGMNKNTDITLKRGVVNQDSSFAQWVNRGKAPAQVRDLVIDSFNEAGQKSSSLHLSGCVVAEYQGMPDLDGPASSATIQFMKLHCAGMKRASQ